MSEETEALRLADALEMSSIFRVRLQAAAELRRLHEAHDWQYKMAGERLRRSEKLEAQRDALLEALCELLADAEFLGWDTAKARAAIKAVEEEA